MSLGSSAGEPTQKITYENIVAHFIDGLFIYFSPGETILNGIDEPEGVYLIKSGFIKAYTISSEGHENILSIHEAGEFIPLPWALDGTYTKGLYYEAMTDVTALRAPKDKLRTTMGDNPWLSQEILKQTVNIITLYTQRIQTLEFRSARGRLIAELLYLAERFGKSQKGEVIIYVPITHQDLADSINMTRETASRALESLTKDGFVGQKDHLFTILNLSKLKDEIN
jgi:CRP/FNR family cyclic AMP-dependent transcriptional regulator